MRPGGGGGRSALTPSECVALLQDACMGDVNDASAAARRVAQQGVPHPMITEAALELLTLHPSGVVSHIPDLISGSASDVSTAVEAFGALLPTDRRLLVPMLGALADLPLTRTQEAAARATLRYALETVDSDDIPAVVRALLRCASATTPARAAVAALRKHTCNAAIANTNTSGGTTTANENSGQASSSRSSGVAQVLAGVVAEHARRSTAVGRALRTGATSHVMGAPLDVAVWLICLERSRAAFDKMGDESKKAAEMAFAAGALLHAPLRPHADEDMASCVARESPQGVVALVSIVVKSLPPGTPASELATAAEFVTQLLRTCPQAAHAVVGELARCAAGNDYAGYVAHLVLLLAVPSLPRGSAVAADAVPSAAALLAARESEAEQAWNALFLRMRKGIVFGAVKDKVIAIRLAHAVACVGSLKTLELAIKLLDSAVPCSLTDPVAVSLLQLITEAVVRDACDIQLIESLFEKRVAAQAPDDLFIERQPTEGQDNMQGALNIDLAAISSMNPWTVAILVGASVSLLCRSNFHLGARRSVVSLIVNSTVRVPVLCLPLYEAAQYITGVKQEKAETGDPGVGNTNPVRADADEDADEDFEPKNNEWMEKVHNLSNRELEEALDGCITCIAALIGVINATCIALPATWRILQVRHDIALRFADGGNQEDLWGIVDRMAELLLMMEAVVFGSSGDASAITRRYGDDSESEGETTGATAAQVKITPALRQRVTNALQANAQPPDTGTSPPVFPVLSLKSTLAVLVAVPDEKCLSEVETQGASLAERDSELTRIEIFALRRLLAHIRGPVTKTASVRATSSSDNTQQEQLDEYSALPIISETEVDDILQGIQEGKDNVFLDGLEPIQEENQSKRRRSSRSHDEWATPLVNIEQGLLAARACRIALGGGTAPGENVLYTPQFAALLLDRAVTNCAVAAERRRNLRAPVERLRSVNAAAAFSLRVLAHLLVDTSIQGESLATFVTAAGNFLLSRFRTVDVVELVPGSPDDSNETKGGQQPEPNPSARIVQALAWVARTSVDATTATLALDCLAVLAELGVVNAGPYRELIADAVARTHEYNEDKLWEKDDLSMLLDRGVQDWITRRRRAGAHPNAIDSHIASRPWLTLDSIPQSNIARVRLRQLLNGMASLDAAREATARAEAAQRAKNELDNGTSSPQALAAVEHCDIAVVCAHAALVDLNALRTFSDVDEALDPVIVTLCHWWTRAAVASCTMLEDCDTLLINLVTAARTATDAQLARYAHGRTDVPALPRNTLMELQQIGRNVQELAEVAKMRANKLKTSSMEGAMRPGQRAQVVRAKNAVPRLQDTAEAAVRTASACFKNLGRINNAQGNRIRSVAVRDGVRAWRERAKANDADVNDEEDEDETPESDAEIEQVDITPMQGGVVINFADAS